MIDSLASMAIHVNNPAVHVLIVLVCHKLAVGLATSLCVWYIFCCYSEAISTLVYAASRLQTRTRTTSCYSWLLSAYRFHCTYPADALVEYSFVLYRTAVNSLQLIVWLPLLWLPMYDVTTPLSLPDRSFCIDIN